MAAKPLLTTSSTGSDIPTGDSIEQTGGDGPAGRPNKKLKRTVLTQHACARCRLKKSKCDGKRPKCARCEKNGADCVYDVQQEGMTRMQSLQSQLGTITDEHEKLQQVFEALRSGNDQESTTLLAKLRMGESIDSLLSYLGLSDRFSPSSQQMVPSPMESQRGGSYNSQWPASPTAQDGYWTSPSESSSRTGSQQAIPQLQPRLPPSDSASAYRTQDSQGGYYTSTSSAGAQQESRDSTYGSPQWQAADGSANISPYYTNPHTGQMGKGNYSRDGER